MITAKSAQLLFQDNTESHTQSVYTGDCHGEGSIRPQSIVSTSQLQDAGVAETKKKTLVSIITEFCLQISHKKLLYSFYLLLHAF